MRAGRHVIHSLSTLLADFHVVSAGEGGDALYTLSRHSLLSPPLSVRESGDARYTLSTLLAVSPLAARECGVECYTLFLVTPCCLHVGRAGERGGALYTPFRHSLLSPRWESGRKGRRVIHSLATPCCLHVGRAGERGGALYILSTLLAVPTLGERESGEARYTLSLDTPCCLHVGRVGERGGTLYTLSRHSLLSLRWESGRMGRRVIHSLSSLLPVFPVVSAGERRGSLYTHSIVSRDWCLPRWQSLAANESRSATISFLHLDCLLCCENGTMFVNGKRSINPYSMLIVYKMYTIYITYVTYLIVG